MKICIAGYYGVGNTGDDLLLQEVCSLWPEAEFSVLGKNLASLRVELPSAASLSEFELVSGWQKPDGLEGKITDRAKTFIQAADLFLIGGGGLLGNGSVFAAPEVFYARSVGTPVALLGVGVNPFRREDIEALRPYFQATDLITTRDHWSWHNLRPFHKDTVCVKSSDPVNGIEVRPVSEGKVPVVLSHCLRWARGDSAKILRIVKQVNAMTEALTDLGLAYEFFAFSPRQKGVNDVELLEDFLPHLERPSEIVVPSNVPDVVDRISKSPYLIGDRFHALVLANRYRIPFTGLAMDSKQRELCMGASMQWYYPHKDNERKAAHAVYAMVESGRIPTSGGVPRFHRMRAMKLL